MSNITNNPSVPSQIIGKVTFPKFMNTLGIIPTSYKDSMDYYEILCWLCKFLEETVIPTVSQNGEAVIELQRLYIQLRDYVDHYLDNYNFQQKVNEKLDEMAESGVLQEIISEYLNSKAIFGFDNVESMKNASNLINGSYAKTLGFYSKNDGGSALYKIRTITNDDVVDNMTILEMNIDESLIAELIINDVINIKQLGAKGDGITDDYSIIQASINIAQELKKNIIVPNGHYIINSSLTLYSRTPLKGEGIVVFDFININTNSDYCVSIVSPSITYADTRKSSDLIDNITFRGYNSSFENLPNGFNNKNLFYITTHEFTINNITAYGFNKVFTYGSNSYIITILNSIISHNNYCIYYDQTGIYNSGERLSFNNVCFGNNNIVIHNYLGMFSFIDCSIDYNLKISDLFTSKVSGTSSGRSSFIGCHFEDTVEKIPRTEDRFVVTNAIIEFTNNEFWFNKLPFIKDTSNSISKLSFVNNDYRITDYNHYFLETTSRSSSFKDNSFITNTTSAVKLSQFENNINQSFNSFITNTTDGTSSLNNNVFQIKSGTYVTGYSQSDYIEIPKSGVGYVWLKFNFYGTSDKTVNKNWIYFYDDNKTQISSVSSNFDVSTTSKEKFFNSIIPNNARYFKITLHSPITNGTTYYSDVYSDFN